jgi:hypothetical protein
MGGLALALALAALPTLAVPGLGKLAALAMSIFATVAGFKAFRRKGGGPAGRLLGAAGVAVGLTALVLAGTKIVLTLVAVERVARLAP